MTTKKVTKIIREFLTIVAAGSAGYLEGLDDWIIVLVSGSIKRLSDALDEATR